MLGLKSRTAVKIPTGLGTRAALKNPTTFFNGDDAASKPIQLVAADGLRLEKTENFNLGPRLPNREYRGRDWLEPGEVEAMIQAVRRYAARHPRSKRFAHRDEAIILLTWRHGLRISEALELKWQSINLTTGHVMVLRRKGSIDGRHPMERDEVHLLK